METQVMTKLKIQKPAKELFEAIVDPVKIGNFWFSSSSDRWEKGKEVTLKYNEYNAEGKIHIIDIAENERIVFSWGAEHDDGTIVAMTLKKLDDQSTIIEVVESGLNENDPDIVNKMTGQKEGWVYMLCCLKAYLEHGIKDLRASLIH